MAEVNEEWRPIPGYEGLYEISSAGRLRSLHRGRVYVMRQQLGTDGYRYTRLTVRGSTRSMRIHRLVALAFIGEPTGPYVLHNDDDRHNNSASNLRYGTASDNNADTVQHGHHVYASRTACAHGHEYTEENTYHSSNGRNEYRICRTCQRATVARYKLRKKAL